MWSTGARIGADRRSARLLSVSCRSETVAQRRGHLTGAQHHSCRIGYIPDMASTWLALSDPHRRAAIELLRERPRSVNELVEELGLCQPGTSKHLRVLREAGLVRVEPRGPAPRVRDRPRSAGRARRLAGAVSRAVGREPRCPRTPPRKETRCRRRAPITELDGQPVVRFERTFPHPVQAVWEAITDPAQLGEWFPTTVEFDRLEEGAPIAFRFAHDAYPPMTRRVARGRAPAPAQLHMGRRPADVRARAQRRRRRRLPAGASRSRWTAPTRPRAMPPAGTSVSICSALWSTGAPLSGPRRATTGASTTRSTSASGSPRRRRFPSRRRRYTL